MPNASVKQRIAADIASAEAGALGLEAFGKNFAKNLSSLEKMPYPLVQQGRVIALQLEHAGWSEDEGLLVQRDPLYERVRAWLTTVPE